MMQSREPAKQRSQDAEMRALFAAFDKDDNGYIDGQELKLTMREVGMDLTNHDVEMMMKAAGVAIKDRIFYEGLSLLISYGLVPDFGSGCGKSKSSYFLEIQSSLAVANFLASYGGCKCNCSTFS